MTFASSASGSFWTSGDRRSGTFMLFTTSEPHTSFPWYDAHFVRNVAPLAALSEPGFACTTETTKSVRLTKSSSRIVEAKITWCSVLSCVMAFSFTCNFSFQLRTILHPRAQRPLTQAELCDRQIPHPLAGCGKNGVAERRHKRRHSWLTDARRRGVAIDHVHVRLIGRLCDSSYRIILKIRLVDCALRGRNLAASHNAGPEHRGPLELRASRFRIYHQARIENRIHARDPHLTLIIDFDLNDRGHVRQETAVPRNPDASALAVLALSPSGFFRDHLCNVAQTTGFPWIGLNRTSVIWILHALEIDRARVPDQVEQIVERITSGRMRQFIREALNSKSVIDVGHRAQPADADVSLRGAILDAKIWQIVRNVRPALLQMTRIAVDRIHIKNGRNRREH